MLLSHFLAINAPDSEGLDHPPHDLIQFPLAEMPEFNRQGATQASEHVDAHPSVGEELHAASADHNAAAAIPAWVRRDIADKSFGSGPDAANGQRCVVERVDAGGGHPLLCGFRLTGRKRLDGASDEICFDPADDFGWSDHVHALWQMAGHVQTQILRLVPGIAIAERMRSVSPTAAIFAAWQRADRVDELMVRIGLPMKWLSPASDHHARAVWGKSWFGFNGRGQVHQTGHRTKNSLCMVHQPHQLPEISLSP